jgi:hypothetical protein
MFEIKLTTSKLELIVSKSVLPEHNRVRWKRESGADKMHMFHWFVYVEESLNQSI